MSIQSEITRIIDKRDLSFEAVEAKGVAVPSNATINDLPNLISQIQADEVFWATYGTTTSAQIEAAYQAGKVCFCKSSDGATIYYLANRVSSTKHVFATEYGLSQKTLTCNTDTWSSESRSLAPLTSPSFSGTPKAPTATSGTNTTQIATTAFVQNALSGKITAPNSPTNGDFLCYNSTSGKWEATTVPSAQGVNF